MTFRQFLRRLTTAHVEFESVAIAKLNKLISNGEILMVEMDNLKATTDAINADTLALYDIIRYVEPGRRLAVQFQGRAKSHCSSITYRSPATAGSSPRSIGSHATSSSSAAASQRSWSWSSLGCGSPPSRRAA